MRLAVRKNDPGLAVALVFDDERELAGGEQLAALVVAARRAGALVAAGGAVDLPTGIEGAGGAHGSEPVAAVRFAGRAGEGVALRVQHARQRSVQPRRRERPDIQVAAGEPVVAAAGDGWWP